MHNKQAILDAVSQALDAMGLAGGDGDEFGEAEVLPDNRVPIWSELQAGTLGSTPGAIHDKSALMSMDRTSKPPTVDAYGMPMPGDQEELLTALGIV